MTPAKEKKNNPRQGGLATRTVTPAGAASRAIHTIRTLGDAADAGND